MLEYLIYLLLIIILILSVWIELYKWHVNRKLKNFVSPIDYPVIGAIGAIIGKSHFDIFEIITKLFENQPDSVTCGKAWLGPKLLVTFSDPEDLKVLLNSDVCLDRPYLYHFLKSSNSVLSLDREQWKHDRRHLNSTLNTTMVASFYPSFNQKAQLCTEILADASGAINCHRVFLKCLLDMHFVTSLSSDSQFQSADGDIVYDAILEVMGLTMNRVVKPWLKWDWIYQLTNEYALEHKAYLKIFDRVHDVAVRKSSEFKARLINHRRNSGDADNNPRHMRLLEKCFQLFGDGKMSEQTLNDNAYLMTLAAVDSSSSAVLNTLLNLAMHPAIQERVVDELRSVFDSADSLVRPTDISRLVYLDMVVKETLRLCPSIPLFARECTADIELPSGTIPKGAIVTFNVDKIHRQQRNWGPKSNEFCPEHFAPENMANMHPYKYMVFGGGNRNCIGHKYATATVKIMLIYFLRRFKFTTYLKMEDIKTTWAIVRRVTNENPINIEPRRFK